MVGVNLGSGVCENVYVHFGDDPEVLAKDFAGKHSLPAEAA